MNNVKVKAKFFNETDGNLDLHSLKVDVDYSIPDRLGFSKPKRLRLTIIKDVTLQQWVKCVSQELTKNKVKSLVQSMVMEDIMSRLKRNLEREEPEILNQVLNMLNQLKFDFSVDLEESKKIIINVNKAIDDQPSLPFGSVRGDYLNIRSKDGEC